MFERIAQYTASLLGRSAYQAPPPEWANQFDLSSKQVLEMRRHMGGQLQLPTVPQTRWYMAQLEGAEFAADGGDLTYAGLLMRAARTDGVFAGVLSTRTGGLVRLPKRFRGDGDVVAALEVGHELTGSTRSVFDEMFPPSELAALAADGVCLGVGVGELIPVEGRDYPVFCRLEPQFLYYRWIENQWYFRSAAGMIPITPGDGRWILHTPGGRMSPWAAGIWRAVGRAYIRKTHAALQKDNWEGKLANPARVAVSPAGAGEAQSDAWFRSVMAWGINTVFGMRPGYDVRLLESNGRGWESFNRTIAEQNQELIISVTGQTVTVDGGAGFQNGDIFKSIRADLIKQTADDVAYTINTQGIPAFVAARWGEPAIEDKPCVVEWDVTPPKDRNAEAQALVTIANAIKGLNEALGTQATVDVAALTTRFGVPVLGDRNGDGIIDAGEKPEPQPSSDQGIDQPARPALYLVEDEDEDAAADGGGEDEGDKIADTAFNGAQVASLKEIVQAVAAGELPRDSAIEIIMIAFNVERDKAEAILGSAGTGPVTAPPPAPVPPPPDAPGEEQAA